MIPVQNSTISKSFGILHKKQPIFIRLSLVVNLKSPCFIVQIDEHFFVNSILHWNHTFVLHFLSPILFNVINAVHIVQEWNSYISCTALIADTVICVAIFIITWFYFFEMHSKIMSWFKKCKPIGWMAKILRKLLKEV